ncbi:MAG: FAD-dependent oxidoreductase, partial [Deltaproteobacteria bacterium]|nr:FAD-dependent oxidoreductase [Deltaproteobacteria bacterium]
MKRYDVIVIGGGHNGLTCAAYLGKAGKKVLVLEAREQLGGIASGGTVGDVEVPGPAATASGFRATISRELGLESHGLKIASRGPRTRLTDGERSIVLSDDESETRASIAAVSDGDGAAYRPFCEQLSAFRGVVQAFTDAHPVDLIHLESERKLPLLRRALGIRRLGRDRMMELTRVAPTSAADWLDEHFDSDLLKLGLAVPGLAQTWS